MTTVAPALVYALFVWWFTTGLALVVVSRVGRPVALAVAAVVFPMSLYGLARSSMHIGTGDAYLAFTLAIVVWGTQEIAFLTGALTGPRPLPCPRGARGLARLRVALGAILYHEISLIASGLAVLAVTWQAPNQVGALTFSVLYVMRVSAKLNLFLGVPVLNDELLPSRVAFLRSYFRRAPATTFFPVSVLCSVLALSLLIGAAVDPTTGPATVAADVLVAALLGLAIVEHAFMLVPLPIARLWAWGAGKQALLRRPSGKPRDERPAEIERVAVPSP